MKRQGVLTLLFGGLLISAAPVLAEEDWSFRLSPYIWFAGLKGDVGTIPPLPSAPIDISASEALDDTEASLMIILGAKKGRHGFYTDLIYTDVQSKEELVPQPIGLDMKSTTKSTIFTLAYQYEVYNHEQAVVDLLAGARYWAIDSELKFGGGLGVLAGKKISNDESWFDPALGIKGRAPLGSSKFYVEGGAGLGGFGVGSDLYYEISANVGYQWNKSIGTAIGYRMFDVDYEDDGYVYDVKQQGWQIGLTWAF
jgi:hypothetical protein